VSCGLAAARKLELGCVPRLKTTNDMLKTSGLLGGGAYPVLRIQDLLSITLVAAAGAALFVIGDERSPQSAENSAPAASSAAAARPIDPQQSATFDEPDAPPQTPTEDERGETEVASNAPANGGRAGPAGEANREVRALVSRDVGHNTDSLSAQESPETPADDAEPVATGSLDNPPADPSPPTACLPPQLRAVLDEVRARFGPVTIVSTTALARDNHLRGSAREHLHLACRAVDFTVEARHDEVMRFLRLRPEVAGLNSYRKGLIHIDAKENDRAPERPPP
jgi:hypothetical protein